MTIAPILVTGFEPYGGHGRNPAFEAMRALDGRIIERVLIRGRGLPVSMTRLKPALAALFDEAEFAAIISLGLQPGASVIQIERSASNLADFEIADNDGLSFRDASVSANGPAARLATLPLRAIERALLAAGIPARLSASAGTFLCNACLYCCLEAVEARPRPPLCGFLHLPCLPEQVAETALKQERPGADVASMELSRIVAGVEIAVRETIRELARSDYESASKKTALP
jgi:pyroglutamyl-peptidase